MFTHHRIRSAVLGMGVLFVVSQAIAHSGASGIVKERMDAMSLLGDHARSVGDMLKGKTPYDNKAVEMAATAFITHGEQIPAHFPDTPMSRSGSKTEALPAIWTEWEDFVALAERFTEDSRTLESVAAQISAGGLSEAEQNRAVRTAFFRASRSCSGCHERFRLDQD